MITHSEVCKSAWAIETHVEWGKFSEAWHFTCNEDCVDAMGHAKPIHHDWSTEAGSAWQADTEPDPPYLRLPGASLNYMESHMPERHTVKTVNTVQRYVYLDEDLVLETEDRQERTLFFETKQEAEDFVSSLAEPVMPEHDVGRICGLSIVRGGDRYLCDLDVHHHGYHCDQDRNPDFRWASSR